ncbi:MAG: alpha/beta hydrolase [Candidatus Berkelbacteria bacterium Gr01-1014_85]|uniref:Alpha/beta hydrolase n=1 Tax=Candidatus Berkelbacteria bacterium Gr01-1014_85 TaxID=2017150 RepID=A0A554JBB6_9BACT|nr:MAG: alpha/beta hydrolase [Candidatus Berkelbacteria bacterium Gr01-1014_85]
MLKKHHVKKGAKLSLNLFAISLVAVSLIGSYIGLRGHRKPVTRVPSQSYQNVSFLSQAQDQMSLEGWFLPASSTNVAIIAHGWGGNRETFLDLAQYLQRNGINVLTFDMRGGTGQNSYGQREAGDIAGAVRWLIDNKQFTSRNIVLIGNSMGGAASIDYAVNHPQIRGLILISSVIDLKHTKRYYAQSLGLIFPAVYAAGVSLSERIFYGVSPTNPIKIFDRLAMPVLVLHGVNDVKSPIADVYSLQKKAMQKVRFEIVSDGSHTFFADKDRQQSYVYSQKIVDFIRSIKD